MTLADEIMALVATHTDGPTIALCMAATGADRIAIREAMERLDGEGRAILAKRGKVLHLLPLDHSEAVCKNCRTIFNRTGKQRTCSRSCAVALSWKNPACRKARIIGIRQERKTQKAKDRQAAANRKRWADPENRKRLSEWNKRHWRDPVTRAERAAQIRIAQSKPEYRAALSERRRKFWADPVKRAKHSARLKEVKNNPEHKKLVSDNMRRRWADPVTRKQLLAAVKRNSAKAADRKRGSKEAPEITARRMAAVNRSKSVNAILKGRPASE